MTKEARIAEITAGLVAGLFLGAFLYSAGGWRDVLVIAAVAILGAAARWVTR